MHHTIHLLPLTQKQSKKTFVTSSLLFNYFPFFIIKMDSSALFFTFSAAIIILYFLRCVISQRHRVSSKLPLPPGTMGWPYVGETFQLYSQDPNVFFASKQKRSVFCFENLKKNMRSCKKLKVWSFFYRYGSVFKTHVLGCPCVMISSPEAAKFVLVTKSHLFKPTFPASKERMLGKQAIFFHQGEYHAKLRKLVLRAFMPESIRDMVPNIESIAQHSLRSWDGTMINTYQEMKTVRHIKKTEHLCFFLNTLFQNRASMFLSKFSVLKQSISVSFYILCF